MSDLPEDKTFEDNSLADDQLAEITNDLKPIQNIMWYGICSILNAFVTLLFYILFNYNAAVAGYYQTMISHQLAYWPVAIGWAAIAIFDNDFTRALYKSVISMSVLGPFAGHFVGFVFLFLNADAGNYWGLIEFWILWPCYIGYIIGQMLIQFYFLPSIYSWLDAGALENELTYFA